MPRYTSFCTENQASYERVMKYLQVLKDIGLTLDEDQQKMVRRRALQICLELQDMKDCLRDSARNIHLRQEMEILGLEECSGTDPSVRFFGLEWNPVCKMCDEIFEDMDSFWTELKKNNTVDAALLWSTVWTRR